MNRIARTILFLFVAAQLLLAVPAGAGAMAVASSAAAADCAEMPGASGDEHCPCCPDGADTLSDCMSACAAVALPTSLPTFAVDRSNDLVRRTSFEFITSLADPPLNPPPIV